MDERVSIIMPTPVQGNHLHASFYFPDDIRMGANAQAYLTALFVGDDEPVWRHATEDRLEIAVQDRALLIDWNFITSINDKLNAVFSVIRSHRETLVSDARTLVPASYADFGEISSTS